MPSPKILFALISTFFVIVTLLLCTLPGDPALDVNNAKLDISTDDSVVTIDAEKEIKLSITFPNLFDSIIIDFGSTIEVDTTIHFQKTVGTDTTIITFKHSFKTAGKRTIVATSYLGNVNQITSYDMNVVKLAVISGNRTIKQVGNPTDGLPFSIYVEYTGTEPVQFAWYRNNLQILNSDNDTLTFPTLNSTDNGTYTCIVKNLYGSDTSLNYTIRRGQNGAPVFQNSKTIQSSGTIKAGSSLLLYVGATGSPAPLFSWYKNSVLINGKTDDTLSFASLSINDTGTYRCTAVNVNGKDTTVAFTISLDPDTNTAPNSSNSDVHLLLISSSGKVDEKVVNDTVGKTLTIRVKMVFPQFIKSTHLEIFSENNVSEFDTSLVTLSKEDRDSIDIERLLTTDGQKTIIVKSLIDDGTFRGDTAIILIAKQSAINHKPNFSITGVKPSITTEEACSLRVTVDDTDLNQLHTTTVSYKSKTDTVKNSLYILKSSVAEIDTLVFITKDNGVNPLSDTQKVIITVITKGTPAAPQWETDTLNVKIKSGSAYTLNLKDTCYDPNGDSLSFAIIPNQQVTGAISGAAYSFTPSNADTGTRAVRIVAKDPGNLSDTLTIKFLIICDPIMNDTVKPLVTLQTPDKDSSSVSASSVTVTVKCTDDNGVASVIGVIGTKEIPFVKSEGDNFTATVSGLAVGLNALKITATDASANTNKNTKTYTINYDPTMADNVGPVFTKISGPASGTVVTDPAVTLVYSITDTNKVDSVYWTLNGTRMADLKAETGDQYTITCTLTKSHENIIVINAQDGSTKKNKNSITITLDYTKRFTLTSSISANVPGVSGTITQTPAGTVIDSNTTVQLTAPADLKYNFTGWTGGVTDTAQTITLVMNGNKTVAANYTLKNFTVKFNSQCGIKVDDQPVAYGGKVSSPTEPARTGYTFGGWYKETECKNAWSFSTDVVTSDTTLFAKWTAKVYTVTFDGNDATVAPDPTTKSVTVPATTVDRLPTEPKKTGFTFGGWWTSGGTQFLANTVVSGNITVSANWIEIPKSKVTFYDDGATTPVNPSIVYVTTNSFLLDTLLPTAPKKTSYTFGGWYTEMLGGGTKITANSKITKDITLYACWKILDADGNEYHEIQIGNQVWTVENLSATRYNDGTVIPLVTDSTAWRNLVTPGFCFYNNSTNSAENKKWGALYNWYAVATGKLAPQGWHVPTDAEWDTLKNYLIANGYNWDNTTSGNKIAKSMAAKTDWSSSTIEGAVGNNLAINNRSGFSALPGGQRDHDGTFYVLSSFGYWWSATEGGASREGGPRAFYRYIDDDLNYLNSNNDFKSVGFSLRLVRD